MKNSYRYILFSAWTLIMLFFLLAPSSMVSKGTGFWSNIPHFDKVVHATIFAIFSFLLINSIRIEKKRKKAITKTIIISILFAFTTELLQLASSSITSRSFETMDIIADITGAIIGVLAYNFIYINSNKNGFKCFKKIFFE